MEEQIQTPVEIVQELIAMHTTRKEAVEKLGHKQLIESSANNLAAIRQQSTDYITALLNELSNFGDNVAGTANRDNEYQHTWKNVLADADAMNGQQREQILNELEALLKKHYQNILAKKTELPASLQEIIVQQHGNL